MTKFRNSSNILALYAATEKPKRLVRALDMPRPGLRKLKRRLVDKGRLTFTGNRRILRVTFDNHIVYKFKPVETETKWSMKTWKLYTIAR